MVILKSLVGCALKIIGQRLQRRLQVIPIVNLDSVVLFEFVVILKQILGHVLQMIPYFLVRLGGPNDDGNLGFHHLHDELLRLFGQHGIAIFVLRENPSG